MTSPLYKVVLPDSDGVLQSCHGGSGSWDVGVTRSIPASTPLARCEVGLHLCRAEHLTRWSKEDAVVLRVHVPEGTEMIVEGNKVIVREATPTGIVGNLNARTLGLFAADCTERALLWRIARGHVHGSDAAAWDAVRVIRAFARGEATEEERWFAVVSGGGNASVAASAAAYDVASFIVGINHARNMVAHERAWQGRRLIAYLEAQSTGEELPPVTLDKREERVHNPALHP